MTASATDAIRAVQTYQQDGDAAALARVLRRTTFFCIRPSVRGFVTGDKPWTQFIAAFSSLDAMSAALGTVTSEPTAWFSAPAAELADEVPDGYNFVLDPGSDHAIKINPSLLLTTLDPS